MFSQLSPETPGSAPTPTVSPPALSTTTWRSLSEDTSSGVWERGDLDEVVMRAAAAGQDTTDLDTLPATLAHWSWRRTCWARVWTTVTWTRSGRERREWRGNNEANPRIISTSHRWSTLFSIDKIVLMSAVLQQSAELHYLVQRLFNKHWNICWECNFRKI